MKKSNQLLLLFTVFFLFLSSCSEKDILKSTVVNFKSNVAIHYPPNYNPKAHSPSFAIINEPNELLLSLIHI